ncbi:ornithine carbamoyltransferase [Buchnera aphidicola (Ceratovacuna keduensis)]|uniref:ornithine carbamoyltransferase n=1 Tax=Buchnera aphidicola TaxID=9 RepID=UPI0031B8A9DF
MKNSLYKKSLLSLKDLNKLEIKKIINLAKKLKYLKKIKKEKSFLKGKKIISIFELNSTRTRCAFEISAFNQKVNVTNLDVKNTHMGKKESIEDTIKIFNFMYDAIQYRGPNHNIIKKIKKYSKIPVWNGLTNKYHPIQILSDIFTIIENSKKNKKLYKITIAYIGDCKNNIAKTILEASNILKINVNMISNKKFLPKIKKKNKKILCTENKYIGLNNVDFIYTDTWFSMNQKNNKIKEKIKLLKKYQINKNLLKKTKNCNTKILHCMPAIHNNKTEFSKKIFKKYKIKNGLEITDEVFKSKNSLVFEQAENKIYIIQAIMILSLKKNINFLKF